MTAFCGKITYRIRMEAKVPSGCVAADGSIKEIKIKKKIEK